jgi:hypothetical protein
LVLAGWDFDLETVLRLLARRILFFAVRFRLVTRFVLALDFFAAALAGFLAVLARDAVFFTGVFELGGFALLRAPSMGTSKANKARMAAAIRIIGLKFGLHRCSLPSGPRPDRRNGQLKQHSRFGWCLSFFK